MKLKLSVDDCVPDRRRQDRYWSTVIAGIAGSGGDPQCGVNSGGSVAVLNLAG
jgi:hypothetical protein